MTSHDYQEDSYLTVCLLCLQRTNVKQGNSHTRHVVAPRHVPITIQRHHVEGSVMKVASVLMAKYWVIMANVSLLSIASAEVTGKPSK